MAVGGSVITLKTLQCERQTEDMSEEEKVRQAFFVDEPKTGLSFPRAIEGREYHGINTEAEDWVSGPGHRHILRGVASQKDGRYALGVYTEVMKSSGSFLNL